MWEVIKNNRAILGKSEDGAYNIQSPIDCKFLTVVKSAKTTISEQYKIPAGTPIFYATLTDKCGTVNIPGTYTIIEKVDKDGKTFGKLKSGAGWINLTDLGKVEEIKKGDKVRVLTNTQYNGNTFHIYHDSYIVLEVSGDRAVISSDGKNVTAAVNVNNIRKI